MTDTSIKEYPIVYHPEEADFSIGYPGIPYSIPGTALKGTFYVEDATPEEFASLPQEESGKSTSALVEPKNETDYVPAPDVPTIITKDEDEEPALTPEEVTVDTQKEHTEKIVEEANQAPLPLLAEDVPLNADSSLEEYLAINMLAGNEVISLEAFPEAQNFEVISDTLQEVMYQNPLILGVEAWGYDYRTLTLGIRYNDTAEEIKEKQEEILEEARNIIPAIIQDGMTDEEKREAIYRYLADNSSYDFAALEAAEANNFQGDIGEEFDDSFTTYGIMVKKVGVCMSYAYSYKLLADLAGVESIVVTGYADGVPHAWNKVKIGEDWLHVDVTNNDSEESMGFRLLYNSNDDTAHAVNSFLNDAFWRDTEIQQFYGMDNSHDYFVVNGLVADSIEAYAEIFEEKLKNGESTIVIRFSDTYDSELLYQTIGDLLYEFAPEKLETTAFGPIGNYVVVYTNAEI